MDASLIPPNTHGTMVEEEEEELGSMPSSSSSSSSSDVNSSVSSDFMDDTTSSTSSSSLSTKDDRLEDGPLYEMSSLAAQLPFKRGLSNFYNGKSQSFASLSNVRSLEDLGKPERPCRKKLKSSKTYGGSLDSQKPVSPEGCSRTTAKKASRGPSFSTRARRRRPPIPPRRSRKFSSHALLFA